MKNSKKNIPKVIIHFFDFVGTWLIVLHHEWTLAPESVEQFTGSAIFFRDLL